MTLRTLNSQTQIYHISSNRCPGYYLYRCHLYRWYRHSFSECRWGSRDERKYQQTTITLDNLDAE